MQNNPIIEIDSHNATYQQIMKLLFEIELAFMLSKKLNIKEKEYLIQEIEKVLETAKCHCG